MFKPGSIRKITVRDFVTYSYAELFPDPNLNVLIGPNGTGKSTIVAAIILGFGGNPKIIGRGTKVSEYVKHNCSEAMIEIQLQGNKEDQLIRITRCFDLHDKSQWALNGKKLSFKEIEPTIRQFNIQVNNLCQFLPQDRVQDFAKLNKQELLQQTQIAICRDDLVKKQENLIEISTRHKCLQLSLEKSNKKLQEFQDANVRIQGKVKNLSKKKKYLKHIEDVERKVVWLKYDELRSKMEEIKADKIKAAEVLNRHKDTGKPLQAAITNAKKTISNIQAKLMNKSQEVRRNEDAVKVKLEKCAGFQSGVRRILGDVNSRLREIERRDQEIRETTEQINLENQRKMEIIQTHGDDSQRAQKIEGINKNIQKLSANINKVVEKKRDLEDTKRKKSYELRCFENELQQLENVRQQRLEWLRRMDRQAYEGVQWLRSNRNLFKGQILEPMMLELNVLNPKHAMFIENVVPVRDKVAFTCVVKEDMSLLIRKLRDQQNLSVNVIYSGNEHPGLNAYQPAIPIEQLKAYGMFAYVRSLVTGPEPIMKYLCKTYQIHNTPVGTNVTNRKYESVPPQIMTFFSDKFRFSTSMSKYTKQKSTRQTEIKSDGTLAITLDAERMEGMRGRIAEVQRECQECDEQIRSLDMKLTTMNQEQDVLRKSLQEFQKCKQHLQEIGTKVRALENTVLRMQQDTASKEQVQMDGDQRIKKSVQRMFECKHEISQAVEKYFDSLVESELDKTNLVVARKQVTFLENKQHDIRRLCEEAEQSLRLIRESLMNATNEAKMALSRAKQQSKGCCPTDNGFDEFREAYNELSDSIEELDAEKEHVLSKINCLNTADVGELRDYENRQQLIVKLQDDIERENADLIEVNANMAAVESQWLEPLQELVNEINKKFSAAFKQIGCAGEVSVYTGDKAQNFADYGLSIKVKYRDAELLQELDNVVQSGGERAVATAAYMLSLQELTPVPFRCVDEINQGMDSNNERRIFDLLVDATSKADTSQYFFITPKLLPNLKYVKTTKVHVVHNGPFSLSQPRWNSAMSTVQ